MVTERGRSILAIVVAVLLLALGVALGIGVSAGEIVPATTDGDIATAWIADVLLLLAGLWVLIGILAARTRLVRRPGAAAARASWIGSTRPWRARESTLGLLSLDRWLLLLVPAGLLVATRLVETSFLSWTHPALIFSAWILFAVVVRLVIGHRSPWPVIAAAGGVVVLRCIVSLAALSLSGPDGSSFAFWTDPVRRVVYIAVAFALFVWLFIALGWALSAQLGVRRAGGAVLAGIGAGLALPAVAVAVIGLEATLTLGGDELGLSPWGFARILGITTYLEIPDAAPAVAAVVGVVLFLAGALLAVPWRRAADAAS